MHCLVHFYFPKCHFVKKVQGNAGPEIDRKVREDLVNLRTIHMEYDLYSVSIYCFSCAFMDIYFYVSIFDWVYFFFQRKGRLPAYFARVFGLQVAPFVLLRDPNGNELEVAIMKKNGKVYFTDGWTFLKSYYGISVCGWVTLTYANRHLFLIEIRNLHGVELAYPRHNRHQRMLLQDDRARMYRSSIVRCAEVALFLPSRFYHTLLKELTNDDIASGMMVSMLYLSYALVYE